MIGLILTFFAGKFFYDLAKEYGKNKVGYAIIGVVSYYGGQFLAGMLIYVIIDFFSITAIDENNKMVIGLLGLPIGILTCFIVYKMLSKRIYNQEVLTSDELLDDSHLH